MKFYKFYKIVSRHTRVRLGLNQIYGTIINIIRRAGTSYCEQDQISTLVFILTTFLRTPAALYCRKKLENLQRTHRQTDRQRIQNLRPLLSPVDRRGERANNCLQSSEKVPITAQRHGCLNQGGERSSQILQIEILSF